MSELGKRDAAELGEAEGLAKRQAGEAGLDGGTSRILVSRGDVRACAGVRLRKRGRVWPSARRAARRGVRHEMALAAPVQCVAGVAPCTGWGPGAACAAL